MEEYIFLFIYTSINLTLVNFFLAHQIYDGCKLWLCKSILVGSNINKYNFFKNSGDGFAP